MTRREYMDILKEYLRGMSAEEKNNIIEYYEEYFDEAGPEREAEVIEELGSPRNLGIRLSGESAVRSLNEQEAARKAESGENAGTKANAAGASTPGSNASAANAPAAGSNAAAKKTGGSVWKTVLIVMALIIGSPLILPAAIVAIVMVFVIIVVIVALGIAAFAILFAGVAAFFVGIAAIFAGTLAKGLLAIGAALLIFGFGILGVLAIIGIVKGIQKLILWIGNRKLNQDGPGSAAAGGSEAPSAENAYVGGAAEKEAVKPAEVPSAADSAAAVETGAEPSAADSAAPAENTANSMAPAENAAESAKEETTNER